VFFGPGDLPSLNLANVSNFRNRTPMVAEQYMLQTCNPSDNRTFPGSTLPDCSTLASGIHACQAKGKIVTISLGGATGVIGFTNDTQASKFADQIWNIFLGSFVLLCVYSMLSESELLIGGSSDTRPFGNAVLDGIDLDVEGGSKTGYTAFVNQIRSHANGAGKR